MVDELVVDDEVVDARRSWRGTRVERGRPEGVELDDGGPGCHREAHSGGLRLHHHELRVRGLGARPGGQSVQPQTTVGRLELGGSEHERGGERDVDHACSGLSGSVDE